jgi:transcriptional repressor NrdR
MLPQVCKKDGRREPFDRMKILSGIKKACEKRPIPVEDIEQMLDRLETRLQESSDKEITTTTIGEWIMKELHGLDEVAYVRFASVYRSFRDIGEFMQELQDLLKR